MNRKVTVIGGPAAPTPSARTPDQPCAPVEPPGPTLIGQTASAVRALPTPTSIKKESFRPTAVPESAPIDKALSQPNAQPPLMPTSIASVSAANPPASVIRPASPTTLQPAPTSLTAALEAPPAASARSAPFVPLAIPGVQRLPVEVSTESLARAFPKYTAEDRDRAQAALSGFSLEAVNPAVVLSFGKDPQEDLTAIVRERLAFAQRPGVRFVLQHLARLQTLLQIVLDSFEGGFLRKGPQKVWHSNVTEIQQLEALLDEADDHLAAELSELAEIKKRCESCHADLRGTALAAEFLGGQLRDDMASLMLSRLGSLIASQAMVIDQINLIDQDAEALQELTLLVQDGVVLKLPSVYSQLAALSSRINDTERFHAVERLTEILNPLKARKHP